MNSWQFQKALRISAEWIHKTWSERYDRKPEINWVPWVITAGNSDSNPQYPQKDAEKIFQTLKDRGMLAYIPVTVTVGGQHIQTAHLSVVNEAQWIELKEDGSIFRIYIWPAITSFWSHPKTSAFVVFCISLLVMFFSHWIERCSKYCLEQLWPSTPKKVETNENKSSIDSDKPKNNIPDSHVLPVPIQAPAPVIQPTQP